MTNAASEHNGATAPGHCLFEFGRDDRTVLGQAARIIRQRDHARVSPPVTSPIRILRNVMARATERPPQGEPIRSAALHCGTRVRTMAARTEKTRLAEKD